MNLTKEEYIDIIENLDFFYGDNLITTAELRKIKHRETQEKDLENFKKKINCLKQLINERFELVDLLKKHYLGNLTIKELDAWLDRSLWHVNKVNELSNKLVELSRVVKSKDEYIIELRNYITQIEREFKDNPPLKFEELK